MAYTRKTVDEWDIEQRTAQGWEVVTTETTPDDARQTVKTYRENQPEYPVRSKKRRVRLA